MNNRVEPRVAHQSKFFVHVHECSQAPEMVGVSVECEAIDFSTRGMQFKTNDQLMPRSLVKITIGIGDPTATYELLGEIRWVRSGECDFSVGVLLHEASNSDYAKWATAFNTTFG